MKKTNPGGPESSFFPFPIKKILLYMKLTVIMSLVLSANIFASAYSQSARFNLEANDQAIRDVLKTIEKSSDFRFFYNDDFTDLDKKVTISANDMSIDALLTEVFEQTNVDYLRYGQQFHRNHTRKNLSAGKNYGIGYR